MKRSEKMHTEKGSVTIMMSLLLLMVLALILGLLESARMQSARAQLLANADMGMFSLFGAYDRDLLDSYDVFFLDGGMGTDRFQKEMLSNVLNYYCGASSEERPAVWQSSWMGLSMDETELTAALLAADEQGNPFLWQAVHYAKEHLVLSMFEMDENTEAKAYLEEGKEKMLQADSISDQIEAIREAAKKQRKEEHEARIQQTEENDEAIEEGPDYSDLEFENPIHTLKRLMQTGITAIAGTAVSEARVRETDLMSKRDKATGWGVFEEQPERAASDGLWLNEYILNKLPCFTKEGTSFENMLKYQTEYVLAGNEEDKENLETVLKQLLLIRFGLNLSALAASAECMGKIEAMAAAIAVACALPVLEPVMKTALLFLWALEEGLTDVRTLCAGGKVEFAKAAEDFVCPIEELFSFQIKENEGKETGMNYKEYLRWMLPLVPINTRVYRCMDMIEHTIRTKKDRSDFRMDTQIFALKANVKGHVRTLFLPVMWNGGELNTVITGTYYTGN